MHDVANAGQEFSFRSLFVPLTSLKAIHWIAVIGFIVYFNAFFNGFVWDDNVYLIPYQTTHVFNIFSLFGVDNSLYSVGYYRPIGDIYISLLWMLFGKTAFFYHFIQVLLQIVCSCLLFFFLKRFFGIPLSLFLSLIFLVHPIQVESVAYISAVENNIYFLFGMIAFLISMKEKLQKKQFILISVFLFLSILTKEPGILFLLMILLYQFFYKRKYFFISIYYSVCTIAVYSLLRFAFGHNSLIKNTTIPIAQLTLPQRLIHIPAIFNYYLQTFIYPAKLGIDQQWLITSLSFYDFYLPLFIDIFFILALISIGIFVYRKNPKQYLLYLFFVVWYLLAVGMLLQIFPLNATVADRWFYSAIVGLLGVIGIFFRTLSIKKIMIKRTIIAVAILCIGLLSIRTMVRNTNYVDQLTLFSHDAAIAKNGFDLEDQLGIMYYQANKISESREHFQKAVSEMPCSDAPNNLAIVDQQTGDLQAVVKDYTISVNCKGTPQDYEHLLIALYQVNKLDLTEEYAKKAIQKYPQGAGFYYILGIVESKRGDKKNALTQLTTAYQLSKSQNIANAIENVKNDKPVKYP